MAEAGSSAEFEFIISRRLSGTQFGPSILEAPQSSCPIPILAQPRPPIGMACRNRSSATADAGPSQLRTAQRRHPCNMGPILVGMTDELPGINGWLLWAVVWRPDDSIELNARSRDGIGCFCHVKAL